ncbi:hypothetical protein [Nocardia bovistercoris]|uniref:Uncharacterized protein n=1 Tax=Nocardia bovistercoris TaxID=2785916 RepID=A0A931I721_9NOCA|nr:hypothetical protein [Nocardia bovistercoris]MBH0775824.1 hypothetical protein [Nocardia bovistercoris]
MNGRTFARAAAAITAFGLGAVLTFGAATAEPTDIVEAALVELTAKAGEDTAAQAGVGALREYTGLVDIAELRHIAANFVPFAYAAPTFGCGSNGPITTIIAAGTTEGANRNQGVNPVPGSLRFSATPAHTGAPLNSGLVVAWVNINNGRSGLDTLDDRTEVGLPTLSRTVDPGTGTVLAVMWGVINYPFANCVMTPTVGTFVVPELPAAPPAPAPPPPAAQDVPAPTIPGFPPPPAAG